MVVVQREAGELPCCPATVGATKAASKPLLDPVGN